MPIVFDVAGVAPADVVAAPSELGEMLALLHVVAEPDHHRDRDREVAAVRAATSPALAAQLARLAPLWARFRLRAMMPLAARRSGAPLGFDAEIQSMLRLPVDAFFRMACEAIAGGRLAGGPDPLADEAAYLELCRGRSEGREDLARALLRDPAAFREQVARVLVQFHTSAFAAEWARIGGGIDRAADAVRERAAGGRIAELLASLAPDSHLFGQRQQVVFDKLQSAVVDGRGREIVLLPSAWTRPHVVVKYDASYGAVRVPIIVQFPLPAAGAGVALATTQRRLLVLADGPRLQINRHLVNESCSTTELAARTGMSRPQVSRHLRRLREAGLLLSTRDGKMVKHRLRSDLVYQLGHEFLSALTR